MASDIWKSPKGLKSNARSPGSISNAQHHDPSMAERDLSGSPGTPDSIITPTSEVAVPNGAVLRVMNTDTAVQFIFIGKESDVPAGAPDITNGYAIPPNFPENIYLGELIDSDSESIFVKTSDGTLQVIVFKP